MASVTEHRLELTGLDKGVRAMIQSLKGSVGELRAGVDTLNNALAAVGVTLGLGAMIAFARDTLKATAALDDMAESTGASVESLSAIRRVAQVGGHDFEGLTAQIGKTIKGLRESSEDGGRAAKAFEAVGVQTRDSSGRLRDMSDVLVEFARKLDKYQDSGNKVALVQDALGKGAERYIPLLKDMADGTDLVATTTTRQAAEAEKADKAMRRLGVTMEDGRRELVNEYTPALTEFLETLLAARRASGGWAAGLNTMLNAAGEDAGARIQEINDELERRAAGAARNPRLAKSFIGVEGPIGGMGESFLLQERELLKFQQRQAAHRLIDDSNLDARDLRLRGKPALDYKSDSGGAGAKILREAEFRAQKQVELEEMALQDMREAQDRYSNYFKGVLEDRQHLISVNAQGEIEVTERVVVNQQRVAEIQLERLQVWFNEIDQEQADAYERGQEYLDSEQNRSQEHLNKQLNILIAAREQGLLTEEEFNERRIELEIGHQERLTGVTNTAYQQRQRFIQSSMLVQAQTIFGELANITAGVAQHNKTLFQINKVAGIANAIINAYTGISKTMAAYPYPWNIAMAALHGAAAFAQVQAIRSTQFGGGGSGSAPSISGSTAAPPVSPVAPAQAARGPDTFISLRGEDMFSGQSLVKLVEKLNEFSRDGGRIMVSTS